MEQPVGQGQFEQPKFSSPEEELKYLRERVAQKENQVWKEREPARPEAAISSQVIEYAKSTPAQVLEEHMIMENPQFEKVVEHLSSIPHREKVREYYRLLAEKGVLNTIRVVQAQNNPHIEEDFHRVLVEYVKTGGALLGLDKEKELQKELHMTVYEVTLPFAGAQAGDRTQSFRDVITQMERFYIGMIPPEGSSAGGYGPLALELVLSNFSNDIVFSVTVEEGMKDMFIKQVLSAFPTAKIEENPADFNIFNEFGVTSASYATPASNFVYPIQLQEESDADPFLVVINSFTKIERDGEGAAIQIMLYPDTAHVASKVKYAIGQIRQGVSVSRATDIPLSAGGTIVKTFSEFFHSQVKDKNSSGPDQKALEASDKATQMMEEKISAPLVRANIRVVVSSASHERSDAIRASIESSFSQFSRPQGGGLKFVPVQKGRLAELVHQFTYREVNDDEAFILNTKELAHLYHLPVSATQKDAPQLKTVKASSAPAPSDLPKEGTLLGINKYRGEAREVRLTKPDRLRHLYTIGQTGTGKSVFLKNLVVQDILAGNGACFIDPHGSDVQDVLAAVPKERVQDVIYFDPSYTPRPFALNMLEYDPAHPEQKIFVVNEMLAIFKKLYSADTMGPAFEQYFRNATMLVMEDPETGNTLIEIPRVLADANFRNLKLSRCKNPIVVQFWREIATKTSGESGLQNMIPYITNKFDVFISNDVMRPIIAQQQSSFNFRDIMDSKKILLVNLAKGKLGEMNANLIGLILIGKFLMAAMSRVDSFGKQLPDFYLYVDEFQNVATPSISAILSEARKYGLSLNLAHQFIAQLPEDIKGAVFGNVGNMMVFRVGTEDAEFLEAQFRPIFQATDIMKIENRNAYAKILINGKPVPPFNLEMTAPPKGDPEVVEALKNLSYLKYGKDRKLVDDAIMKKYMSSSASAQAPAARPAAPPAPQAAPPPQAPASPSIPAVSTPPPVQAVPVQAPPAVPLQQPSSVPVASVQPVAQPLPTPSLPQVPPPPVASVPLPQAPLPQPPMQQPIAIPPVSPAQSLYVQPVSPVEPPSPQSAQNVGTMPPVNPASAAGVQAAMPPPAVPLQPQQSFAPQAPVTSPQTVPQVLPVQPLVAEVAQVVQPMSVVAPLVQTPPMPPPHPHNPFAQAFIRAAFNPSFTPEADISTTNVPPTSPSNPQ